MKELIAVSLRFWLGLIIAWFMFFGLCVYWVIGLDLEGYQYPLLLMSTVGSGGAVVMSLLEIWEHVNGVHDHR